MSKERSKGLALGAAIGAVAGVITGILFAPKSGKETREDIKDAAANARNRLLEESKVLQAELRAVIDKVEITAKDASSKASEALKQALETAKEALDDLITKTKAAKDGNDPDFNMAKKKAEEAQKALQKFIKK
jgi:gas vesicle protein